MNPEEAIKLFNDACVMLEEDGKEQMAFDLYRDATDVHIKLERLEILISMFLKSW